MTWVVGFRQETGAFLIADFAVTSQHQLQRSTSTFGESQVAPRGNIGGVQEGRLKIFRINDVLISFSGNIQLGEQFIDAFERYYLATSDVVGAIGKSSSKVLESEHSATVEALIAYHDGQPQIAVCKTGCRPAALPFGVGHGIGSGEGAYGHVAEMFQKFLSVCASRTENPSWMVRALALWQSFGVTRVLMDHNAGGRIFRCLGR